MTREVKNGKVAFEGGQCGRMDHHVWQVVPGTNNTVREKVFGGINGAMRLTKGNNKCIAVRKVATPLRELTCHMGSHSVTCHPTEVIFPPLPQPKLVLD